MVPTSGCLDPEVPEKTYIPNPPGKTPTAGPPKALEAAIFRGVFLPERLYVDMQGDGELCRTVCTCSFHDLQFFPSDTYKTRGIMTVHPQPSPTPKP